MIGFLEKFTWVATILVVIGSMLLVVLWKRGAPSRPQSIKREASVMMSAENLAELRKGQGDEGKIYKADNTAKASTGNTFSQEEVGSTKMYGTDVKVTKFSVEAGEVVKYRTNFNDLYDEISNSDAVFVQDYKGKPAVQVTKVAKNTIVDRIGLQVGDVVMAVNNNLIEGPNEAFALYEKLKGENSFTVEIERNGKIEVLHYNIR